MPRRAWTIVVASAVALIAVGALASLGTALRTNDDAHMLASVSGFTGGESRPELIFTHVGIGLVLEWLYGVAPQVAWYGGYLLLLLLLGLTGASLATLRMIRPVRATGSVVAAGVVVASTIVVEVSSLQFTVVAIMLAGSGVLVHAALRTVGASAAAAAATGGAIALLGLAVRVQGFVVGAAVAGGAIVLRDLVRMHRDARGMIALAVVLVLGGGVLVGFEQAWWQDRPDTPRSVGILDSGLSGQQAGTGGAARTDYSANDRALIDEDWLRFPQEQFLQGSDEVASPRSATSPDALPAAPGGRRGALPIPSADDLDRFVRDQGLPLALVLLVAIAAPSRRGRVGATVLALGGIGLLVTISGTRLPDRVGGPTWLLLLLGVLVVGSAAGAGRRLPVQRAAGALALVVAGLQVVTHVALATDRAAAHEARRDRAETLISDLHTLGGPDATFVLWLVDPWVVLDPLDGSTTRDYSIRTVEVAGWVSTLPYYRDMRDDYGASDWIGAVSGRDDVLLVASAERVERLQVLLRERRGQLCTQPDIAAVVNDGFDVLVRRIRPEPCAGAIITP